MNQLKYTKMMKLYKKAGVNVNLKFKTIDQVKEVLNINLNNIIGYKDLGYAKKIFERFLIHFLNGIGLEERTKIKPLSVCIINKYNNRIMRFDYKYGKEKHWLHVKSSNVYY